MAEKIRVLLADPDNDSRYLLSGFIDDEEDMVVAGSTDDSAELLEMIRSLQPHVVVMGLGQKDIYGIDVLQKLSHLKQSPPVIIVTAFYREDEVQKAASLGAYCFLQKPYNILDLLVKIRQAAVGNREAGNGETSPPVYPSLDKEISEILQEFKMPARIGGYKFLRDGIIMAIEKPESLELITKYIYLDIARKYNTTSSRVERAMRHAIESSWEKCSLQTIRKYFGPAMSNSDKRPSNGNFIAAIADYLQLKKAVR